MDKKKLVVVLAALGAVGVMFFWPKKARAQEAAVIPPQPPPTPEPEAAPALPPAPPSTGNPAKVEYWAQKPPPGRETVGPTEPINSGTAYIIKAGESWSNIAERTYGDYRWWPYLWDMNRAQYPDYTKVKGGNSITIPSKSGLPVEKRAAYFARAEAERKAWIDHKKAGKFGKSWPKIPASVTTPTP